MEQLERTLPRLLRHCTMHSRQWNEDVIIKEFHDGHNGHRPRVPVGRPLFKVTVHNSFWIVETTMKISKRVPCRLHGDKKEKRRHKTDYKNPQKIYEDNLNDHKQTQDWLQWDWKPIQRGQATSKRCKMTTGAQNVSVSLVTILCLECLAPM